MNRDHALFLVIGILVGFIAGYLAQDYMILRQAQRVVPGTVPGVVAGGGQGQLGAQGPQAGAGMGQQPPTAAAGGGAPMAQVQVLQQRLAADPDDAEAILGLANLNYEIANWPRASELYGRYVELRPEDPRLADILSDLGVAQRQQGDLDAARASFDRAQEIRPDHWQSRFNEVMLLAFDRGDLDGAREVLAELQALQPDNAQVAELAAEVERRSGG